MSTFKQFGVNRKKSKQYFKYLHFTTSSFHICTYKISLIQKYKIILKRKTVKQQEGSASCIYIRHSYYYCTMRPFI